MDEHKCTCQNLQRLKTQNPAAFQILQDIAEILTRKSEDYSPGEPFEAFKRASKSCGEDTDSIFRVLIALKTSREISLLDSGHEPNYESLQDTRMDRACYAVLQCAYHLDATGTMDT
jgi:hypothetical protein